MKQGKLLIGLILLALMQLVACERNDVDSSNSADRIGTSELEGIKVATTTTVQKGEPVLFALENGLSPLDFQWKISPKQDIRVEKIKTVASIYFPQSGKYTVTAIDSISQDSVSLIVDVVIYEPGYDNIEIRQPFDADDILSLTPITFSDSTFHLEFLAETKNTYKCNNNYMLFSRDKVQDTFVYDFLRVISPAGCATENAKSKQYIYTNEPIVDGKTYNLEITFNGKNYKGSFTRNGGNYQFTWPYDDGVIFTKKTL
ncbi:hypothetical protein ACFP1I_24195 [Dyadobacter subterraneus]|uniref:PKD domain-containing protein n=1 Tax=Dyadobacter subterraneus TaxID=2773304 RepID=A0ABR9WM21_9BACT|nr:hypothetical protein [Dyadobacter subterraneus]MBE9466450.1 hypothetical protein [Dyadobacter subterraneus]